ncbi:gliding motility-associated C-terminal domain-containing protein [uncultured Aquimarina sp.]|uniref:T9SS type B sorting domain-containing protein n=1 Tax=uncultured Aquimarina sp. TaxID=575652 RepID=UPI0026188FAE|nr:gliding motility-associated C-terminal domain-containing protein [uncultured Aquimarina sp.]
MNLNFKTITLILLNLIILLSCNESDDPETELLTFLCCKENPFLSQNIDNLDQSNGEINVSPVFTPNGDGFYDRFGIENIDLYSPNSVTLFNLNDEIVYSTQDYSNFNNFLGGNDTNLESGTYKYKVVVENEQTFLKFGYVCIVKTPEDGDGFSFSSECSLIDFFDPILR